jgi:phosphatidylethanolamine/phosphatidyl-N-methylethanolamine N-methyltransferase
MLKSDILSSYLRFFVAGLTKQGQTGALVPSGRFLVSAMIAPIPANYTGQVVELGAGTGVLTLELASRCPRARILACEINPALAADLSARIARAGLGSRIRVRCDSAEHLLVEYSKPGARRPDFIVSGIPLGTLDKEKALALVQAINRALAPGGRYIQFQYSLIDRKKIKATFGHVETKPVLLNLPPAFVYHAQKAAVTARAHAASINR